MGLIILTVTNDESCETSDSLDHLKRGYWLKKTKTTQQFHSANDNISLTVYVKSWLFEEFWYFLIHLHSTSILCLVNQLRSVLGTADCPTRAQLWATIGQGDRLPSDHIVKTPAPSLFFLSLDALYSFDFLSSNAPLHVPPRGCLPSRPLLLGLTSCGDPQAPFSALQKNFSSLQQHKVLPVLQISE